MKDKNSIIIYTLSGICLLLLCVIIGISVSDKRVEKPNSGEISAITKGTSAALLEMQSTGSDEQTENVSEEANSSAKYTVSTKSTPLGIRKEADSKAEVFAYIPKGATIEVTKSLNQWGYTEYHNISGWVNLDYCKPGENYAEGVYYVVTEKDPLSLRADPNRNADVVTRIPRGEQINLTEIDSTGTWGLSEWGGYTGWVMMKYVTYGVLPENFNNSESETEEMVFVLISEYAKVYHKYKNCDGLDNANPSHELRQVTVKEAENMGRRPCKLCY